MSTRSDLIIHGSNAREIAGSIEMAVRAGRLMTGRRLPSVRALAGRLGLSPATVAAAYRALQRRGLLVADRGGTVVSHRPANLARYAMEIPADIVALHDGYPDPALLPDLRAAMQRIETGHQFYDPPYEDTRLLELAGADLRAENVRPGPLLVMRGALDAIDAALSEHLRHGDPVAVEDPGFGGIFDLLASRGFRRRPVGVDAEGLLPAQLDHACRRGGAKALIVTPRWHNPTGATLSQPRSRELRRVLRRYPDVMLIEDDHVWGIAGGELWPLHVDRRNNWLLVRSFAKSLGPGLRLSVVTGDEASMARLRDRQILRAGWAPLLLQRWLAELLGDGGVRRLLTEAAQTYAARRKTLIEALAAAGLVPAGGMGFNLWLAVREEATVAPALMMAGFAICPGVRFRIDSPPGIRVTASKLTASQARSFAAALSAIVTGRRASASV